MEQPNDTEGLALSLLPCGSSVVDENAEDTLTADRTAEDDQTNSVQATRSQAYSGRPPHAGATPAPVTLPGMARGMDNASTRKKPSLSVRESADVIQLGVKDGERSNSNTYISHVSRGSEDSVAPLVSPQRQMMSKTSFMSIPRNLRVSTAESTDDGNIPLKHGRRCSTKLLLLILLALAVVIAIAVAVPLAAMDDGPF